MPPSDRTKASQEILPGNGFETASMNPKLFKTTALATNDKVINAINDFIF